MTTEQDKADITPYELARRLTNGQDVTDVGKREIAEELLRVQQALDSLSSFVLSGAIRALRVAEIANHIRGHMDLQPYEIDVDVKRAPGAGPEDTTPT